MLVRFRTLSGLRLLFKKYANREDSLLLLYIFDAACTFYYLNKTPYLYRDNSSSSMASFRARQIEDMQVFIPLLLSHAKIWGSTCLLIAWTAACMHLIGYARAAACDRGLSDIERISRLNRIRDLLFYYGASNDSVRNGFNRNNRMLFSD